MTMRHVAELKLSKELTLDEKIDFLSELKTRVNLLSFVDMQSSLLGSKKLEAFFKINAVDDGKVKIEGTEVIISTTLNFTKLIGVYEIAKSFLGENVIDFKYPEVDNPELPEEDMKDEDAAAKVEADIRALPEVAELQITDKEQVEAARIAFEKLTSEQQALVKNIEDLILAEGKIAELEKAVE